MSTAHSQAHKEIEDELDEALRGSFPASDPPALTSPSSLVARHREQEINHEQTLHPLGVKGRIFPSLLTTFLIGIGVFATIFVARKRKLI